MNRRDTILSHLLYFWNLCERVHCMTDISIDIMCIVYSNVHRI